MTVEMKMTREYQDKVSSFVSREVIYCVSYLVGELLKNEAYMDDLLELCTGTEWLCPECGDCFESEDDSCEKHPDEPLDESEIEVYEHWIVTKYLGDKLQARGAIVGDFMDMRIWGRTTTGQSIMLDGVIQEIYDEMMK